EISPRLRQSGHYGRRGPASQVLDRTAEKAYLAQLASEDADRMAQARRRLATGQRLRLSHLPVLDEGELDIVLDLLGAALAGRATTTDIVNTVSSDGTLTIKLESPEDGSSATVSTPLGLLRGPDFWITIRDAWAAEASS